MRLFDSKLFACFASGKVVPQFTERLFYSEYGGDPRQVFICFLSAEGLLDLSLTTAHCPCVFIIDSKSHRILEVYLSVSQPGDG